MRQGRLRLVEGKIVWLYVAAALCRPSNILLIRILLHLRILTIPICIPHPFYNCTYYGTYTHKLSVGSVLLTPACKLDERERERVGEPRAAVARPVSLSLLLGSLHACYSCLHYVCVPVPGAGAAWGGGGCQ